MLQEVVTSLRPNPGGRYVDGTLGGGGHAEAILKKALPNGWLAGCDRDEAAVNAASCRLAPLNGQVDCRVGSCSRLGEWIPLGSIDGVIMDLGVSSPQLDQAERGFSIQKDGPLDMRMDSSQSLTAATVINEWGENDLATIFRDLGEERQARRLARAVVCDRPIVGTAELAGTIARVKPRRGRLHPATKVFQAIRMAVNDELFELNQALPVAASLLKTGGRLAVVSFHSVEARAVKRFGKEQTRNYDVEGDVDQPAFRRPRSPFMQWVNRRAVRTSDEEVASNPRARSAQLRVLEKC